MANSTDPDQLASNDLDLFAKAGHIWVQQDRVKEQYLVIFMG